MSDAITMPRAVAEQVLEALRLANAALGHPDNNAVMERAITALSAALAAQQAEPVAWRIRCVDPLRDWTLMYSRPITEEKFSNMEVQPLYPPCSDALAQQAEPVAYSELKPWAHASRVQSDEETYGLGVDDFGRCGSSSSAVVGCSGLVAGSEFAARERRMADMNRAQQAEPVAYLYSTIADVAVFHRVQQIGHAEALYSQAQLANDMKAAREYPNAHSVVALYTAPPRREWVSLTDDEIKAIWNEVAIDGGAQAFARATEAACKEKNHG